MPVIMRFGASLFTLAVIGLFIFMYRVLPGAYFHVLYWLGDTPYRYPFLDLESIMRARICAGQGINVYLTNPCMGGSFNYSPLMISPFWPVIGPDHRVGVGLFILAAYAGALSLLPPPDRLAAPERDDSRSARFASEPRV
ncbi:MAG: hypothetical protein POH28_03720 [Acidocella sp.]|nr:hypothetical protein [Acidocella sp.]